MAHSTAFLTSPGLRRVSLIVTSTEKKCSLGLPLLDATTGGIDNEGWSGSRQVRPEQAGVVTRVDVKM